MWIIFLVSILLGWEVMFVSWVQNSFSRMKFDKEYLRAIHKRRRPIFPIFDPPPSSCCFSSPLAWWPLEEMSFLKLWSPQAPLPLKKKTKHLCMTLNFYFQVDELSIGLKIRWQFFKNFKGLLRACKSLYFCWLSELFEVVKNYIGFAQNKIPIFISFPWGGPLPPPLRRRRLLMTPNATPRFTLS